MIYKWSKKIVKILHFINISFKRLIVVAVVLTIGTALLSAYTLINLVNSIAVTYKDSPLLVSLVIILLVGVPTTAYVLERGLNSYLMSKSRKSRF